MQYLNVYEHFRFGTTWRWVNDYFRVNYLSKSLFKNLQNERKTLQKFCRWFFKNVLRKQFHSCIIHSNYSSVTVDLIKMLYRNQTHFVCTKWTLMLCWYWNSHAKMYWVMYHRTDNYCIYSLLEKWHYLSNWTMFLWLVCCIVLDDLLSFGFRLNWIKWLNLVSSLLWTWTYYYTLSLF